MSTPIDLHTELDATAKGKVRGGDGGRGGRDGPVDETGLMAQIRSGENYHPAALTLAGYWAYRGVSFKAAARQLQALFDETPETARDQRWKDRRGELFHILDWVYGREQEKSAPGPDGGEVIDLGLLKAALPQLAKLPAPEYEARRKAAAAQIKIPATRLDTLVKKERAAIPGGDDLAGQAVVFPKDAPWPEEVELTDLLDVIDELLQEMMVMTDAQRLGVGLWVIFTHCLDAFDTSPRLIIRSALKRSGKSRLLRLIRGLVARGIGMVGLSASGLFRVVDRLHPTLLLDESDNYLTNARTGAGADLNLALQALINGGFDRDDSSVLRIEGDRVREPRLFSTWCALGMARIGLGASTIEDRSVTLVLARKATSKKVERLGRTHRPRLALLRRQAARWAADHSAELGLADPPLPEFASDRSADAWRPLISIADLGGAVLGAQAREAALTLGADQEAETQEIELQALADIKPWLEATTLDPVFTSELVDHLHTLEHRPWPEYGRKRAPISKYQLSRLLARIDLISAPVWRGKVSARGYTRERLEYFCRRYVFADAPTRQGD